MKCYFYLVALVAMFAAYPLEAREKQKWENQPYKYEFNVGWATILDNESFPQTYGYGWDSSSLDMMYADERGPIYTAGGFSAEFGMNFRRWFTLAINASVSGIWHEAYNNISKEYYTKSGAQMAVMPVARFLWIRKRTFRLYSSVGLGAGLSVYDGKTSADIATCIIPLGMQFGSKMYGLVEFGGGSYVNMQGVRFGMGVKF